MSIKEIGSREIVSAEVQKESFLTALPPELLLTILENLNYKDIGRLSLTCRYFNDLGTDNSLWNKLVQRDWPYQIARLSQSQPICKLPENFCKLQYRTRKQIQSNFANGTYKIVNLSNGHRTRITYMEGKDNALLTGSFEGPLKVWHRDLSGGFIELQEFEDFNGTLSFNEDQTKLAYSSGAEIKILLRQTAAQPFKWFQTISRDESDIKQLQINKDFLFSLSENKKLVIWKQIGHNHELFFEIPDVLMFCIYDTSLVVCTGDKSIYIWKKNETGNFVRDSVAIEKTESLGQIIWLNSTDQNILMSDSIGMVKIFQKNERNEFHEIQKIEAANLSNPATYIAFYEDCFFVGCLRGTLIFFTKKEDGQFQHQADIQEKTQKDRINSIAYKDGRLVAGSTDGSAVIYERAQDGTFRKVQTLREEEAITCVGIEDGKVSIACSNGSVKIYNFEPTHTI